MHITLSETQVKNYNNGHQKVQEGDTPRRKVCKGANTDNTHFTRTPKDNLKSAIKNGSLMYTEPTKALGITLRKGFYTYLANGNESYGNIKKKFGIPDKVLSSMNAGKDDEYTPKRGENVYFRFD